MVPSKNLRPFKLVYKDISYEYKGKETICKLIVLDNWGIWPLGIEMWAHSEPKHNDRYNRMFGEKVALAKAEKGVYQFYKEELKKRMLQQDLYLQYTKIGIEKCNRIVNHNIDYIKSF